MARKHARVESERIVSEIIDDEEDKECESNDEDLEVQIISNDDNTDGEEIDLSALTATPSCSSFQSCDASARMKSLLIGYVHRLTASELSCKQKLIEICHQKEEKDQEAVVLVILSL